MRPVHCAACGGEGHNRRTCADRAMPIQKALTPELCTVCGDRHGCLTCGRGTKPSWKCSICNGLFPDATPEEIAKHKADQKAQGAS